MLHYTPTPIQEIHSNLLTEAGVRLLIKREDLNHPHVSGNKWWKLKYNIAKAVKQNKNVLLTFGGAYSNHIYSTAAAAQELGLKSIGVIRGEETLPLNTTLTFAKACGMQLHYVTRENYRNKSSEAFIQFLADRHGEFYLIPEGGSNLSAVEGCAVFAASLRTIDFDYLCTAVGTGGTISGIIKGLKDAFPIIGFPVLKGGGFLKTDIKNFLREAAVAHYNNWRLDSSYHHGGYAKVTQELLLFIQEMKLKHDLPLDSVYTGKMLWGVMDYIKKGNFKCGTTVLALHTGGLQGAYD